MAMIDGIDAIAQLGSAYFRRAEVEHSQEAEAARFVEIPESGLRSLPRDGEQSIVIGDSLSIEGAGAAGPQDGSGIERIMSGLAEMDGGYREITGRITDWPSFSSYLERHGISGPNGISERDGHVSNIDDVMLKVTSQAASDDPQLQVEQVARKLEAQQRRNTEFYTAGIEYQRDSAAWFLGTEFWLTKVKVLTAAVSQVGRGLRTLFMSQ